MAEDKTSAPEVKLDERVAAKLDSILAGLNALKDSGVDWKSVFISVGLNVVILTSFYFFQVKDLATREYVDQEIFERSIRESDSHNKLYDKLYRLEVDVKKLKEHRIGSVGQVGDEGPK